MVTSSFSCIINIALRFSVHIERNKNIIKKTTKTNTEYYNKLYGHRNPLLHWLHGRISFDQQSKTKLNRKLLMPIINSFIKDMDKVRVLDYGCGWGTFLLSLPRNKILVYGFDIIKNTIKTLEKTMQLFGRQLFCIEINEDAEISPNGFDIILCSHVLEHVENDLELLLSLKKALKPTGYLLINVPINEVWEDPKHFHNYDVKILTEQIKNIGMNVISIKEEDRWSGFLLRRQMTNNLGKISYIVLRIFRSFLAVMPLKFIQWSERQLLKKDVPQQLLILASNNYG